MCSYETQKAYGDDQNRDGAPRETAETRERLDEGYRKVKGWEVLQR